MAAQTAQAAVAAQRDLRKASHTLDIEMKEVAWAGGFVPLNGWSGMQIAPAAKPDAP
jgi:hypothetical protein